MAQALALTASDRATMDHSKGSARAINSSAVDALCENEFMRARMLSQQGSRRMGASEL